MEVHHDAVDLVAMDVLSGHDRIRYVAGKNNPVIQVAVDVVVSDRKIGAVGVGVNAVEGIETECAVLKDDVSRLVGVDAKKVVLEDGVIDGPAGSADPPGASIARGFAAPGDRHRRVNDV